MPEKTRYPERDLSHADYRTWIHNILDWMNDHSGDPDYPLHLTANFPAKIALFDTALANYEDKRHLVEGKSKIYTNDYELVSGLLESIKIALPTVTPDPPVLSEFGLEKPIPRDRDDLWLLAQNVVNHWHIVESDPKFAPMLSYFDDLEQKFADLTASRTDYYNIFNESQTAQNDVLNTRGDCNENERKIFTWYRSKHRKSTGEWWTETWWGTSDGGGSGGKKLPTPANLRLVGEDRNVKWDEVTTTLDYILEQADNVQPLVWKTVYQGGAPDFKLVEPTIGTKLFRVRAKNESAISDWSASISFTWDELDKPKNLTGTNDPADPDTGLVLDWGNVPHATRYEVWVSYGGSDPGMIGRQSSTHFVGAGLDFVYYVDVWVIAINPVACSQKSDTIQFGEEYPA